MDVLSPSLIWYNLYTYNLKKEGFLLNPYEKFMANKTINVKQCTSQWYVDNNKVTHVSYYVITGVINIAKKILESWSHLMDRNIHFMAQI